MDNPYGDSYPFKDFLGKNRRFLLRIDQTAEITTDVGLTEARLTGEAVLGIYGDHQTRLGVLVERLGLAGTSVKASQGETGIITVIGRSSNGLLNLENQANQLTVEVMAEINYESLDEARVPDRDKGCYYTPAFEPCAARLSGEVLLEKGRFTIQKVRLDIACAAGEFGQIQAISVYLDQAILDSLDSNLDGNLCDSSHEVNERRLNIHPVFFQSTATDPNPTGGTLAAQLATARAVWGKSCIDINVVLPATTITSTTLKTSTDLAAIRGSFTHSDANVIEVYFIDNPLSGIGGGSAGAIGVASCKIVMAEPNGGNPVLLAHELGHVLGLQHPSTTSNSDPGTVMAPTGSAMVPGTEFVTHFMCTNIANPVLQTLMTQCCLSHDIGNHFLKDFPVDIGLEPSDPLPPGMTRYSMSNVWNRQSNTPGTFSTMTGPEHENPARFDALGNPFTNFLFARVEQRENLRVRDARVKFYLKHPGSGGGGSNLQLVGEAPVPASLAVGTPQNVSVAWTIPAGTPNHSCIFAVVRSDAEPDGSQSGLDWQQFENLCRMDNDWAQRNLDFNEIGSGNINFGDGNVYGAPYIIRIPELIRKQFPVQLDINTNPSRSLETIFIEIPGVEEIQLEPGFSGTVELQTPVTSGEDYPIIIRLIVPPGLKRGERFSVEINPVVGGG